MSAHVGFDVWPAISAAIAMAKGRVIAAISYVGKDGHGHLPLERGDLLICDASLAAVRAGATNPTGLRRFLEAGVDVYSVAGLHAKVVVLPRRAFVGSQNASAHSANGLLEAALETTDAADVRALRAFVLGLPGVVLTLEAVDALGHDFPKRVGPRPLAHRAAAIPDDVRRLVVVGVEFDAWTTADSAAFEHSRKGALSLSRQRGAGARAEPIAATAWVFARLRRGDWVLQRSETHWYSPGIVVEKSTFGGGHVIWLSRPPCSIPELLITKTTTTLPDVNVIKVLVGAEANAAADVFR